MAKTKRKSAKKPCPPCTEARMARDAFAHAIRAGRCDIAGRAYDKIKSEVGARAEHMTKGARALAFRELLSKQHKVDSCRSKAEASDASRFNGLLGLGFLGL